MPRLARVIAVDVPHHVTQRGNAQQQVFDSDSDYMVYLDLLGRNARLHHLPIGAYCLMPNHVHIIATPSDPDALRLTLRETHGRYAVYRNSRRSATGHLWQGRYYSCPMDIGHHHAALRYVETNPVRARLVQAADDYPWSSAAEHCGGPRGRLELAVRDDGWTADEWRAYLARDAPAVDDEIRDATHSGRPLGSGAFIHTLEIALGRRLAPQPGGRPSRKAVDARQQVLDWDAL
jgi:putative transposase